MREKCLRQRHKIRASKLVRCGCPELVPAGTATTELVNTMHTVLTTVLMRFNEYHLSTRKSRLRSTAVIASDRPVGLAPYGRLNRKSVGSSEAVPLKSAPPTSGIVNILMAMR
eukprot:6181655-Pleurochrysis_carterae.AAC.2